MSGRSRLLAVMDLLQQETDDEHHMPTAEFLARLAQRGIQADRKSLYRDFEALEDAGWNILYDRQGYYLASQTFELAELKLLVDAVQCARFITEKKSYALIRKLETLTSRFHSVQLQRQLHLVGRPKATNEQIYYNIDAIYNAIDLNREITFDYMEWHSDGMRHRRDKSYRASPYGLCWESENYYLVAHMEPRGRRHFRVDRMADIRILKTPRLQPELYRDFDMARYTRQVFGMFGGSTRTVTLCFPEELADSAVDKFGPDILMIPRQDGTFTLSAEIAVSPVFFSWVFSFGGRVKITGPDAVVQQYRQMCLDVLNA